MKLVNSYLTQKPTPTCTYFSITAFLLLSFLYTIYNYNNPHHHNNPENALKTTSSRSHFHHLFLSSSTNSTFPTYLRSLTLHPHLAGTPSALHTSLLLHSHFRSLGLETHTVPFNALLSYPTHSSLTAHLSNGTLIHLPTTEAGAGNDILPPYHAYAPSGSVKAEAVFANYGREEDYDALGAQHVEVEGKIVLVRKGGGISRGGLVRIAEAKGALGVLMYAEGDRIMKGGVERGTVMQGIGDPLSPGWGSVEGGEVLRVDDKELVEGRFPKIPSFPVSFECAEMILRELGGGVVPEEWKRELRTGVRGVGPGPLMLNLTYQGEKKMATIHNVFAIVRGLEEPDRYVLLGNHRDAWTYGAVDPNSGTAALLDIARRYALMMQMGWNPRRTIILCSWDAEEFGMIGSTEWVEQNIMNLGSKAVAYLNVDCAVQGPGLFTGATPQLDNLLIETTKKIKDPDSEKETVFEAWRRANRGINIQRLSGVDSDFAPFLQHAGVPSVDIYYGRDFPVYHTAFDTYDWMTKFGDPFFHRHVAASGIWGLMALRLADDAIIPFNYVSYAEQLAGYVETLRNSVDESISLHPLTSAIEVLHSVSKDMESNIMKLKEQAAGNMDDLSLRALNDRLMFAERGFLDADGLPGNRWFKHLVYGPTSNSRTKLSVFPSISDAIARTQEMSKSEGQPIIQHEIWRVARAVLRAADILKGELL